MSNKIILSSKNAELKWDRYTHRTDSTEFDLLELNDSEKYLKDELHQIGYDNESNIPNETFLSIQSKGNIKIRPGYLPSNTSPSTDSTLTITSNVYAQSFIATSDRKLKKNIESIKQSSNFDKINPVTYNWKHNNDEKKQYGFIAQEIEKIYPDFVYTTNTHKTLNYTNFICLLVKEVQDLKKQVKRLKTNVKNLELKLI